jgi:hypothetical protein
MLHVRRSFLQIKKKSMHYHKAISPVTTKTAHNVEKSYVYDRWNLWNKNRHPLKLKKEGERHMEKV